MQKRYCDILTEKKGGTMGKKAKIMSMETMREKIAELKTRGYSLNELVGIAMRKAFDRIEEARAFAAQEMERYPQAVAAFKETLSEFDRKAEAADCFKDESLAFNVIRDGVNPVMNFFQKLLAKQAEMASWSRFAKKIGAAKTEDAFIAAFAPIELEGSFFDRNAINFHNSNTQKIFNVMTGLPKKVWHSQ